jgi:hypothetical protein
VLVNDSIVFAVVLAEKKFKIAKGSHHSTSRAFNSRIDYALHMMFLTEETALTKLKNRNCGPDAGPVAED